MSEDFTEFKRTLRIINHDHFENAREFSAKNIPKGKRGLLDCIMWLFLGHYGNADTLVLAPDFVPHSFTFALTKGGELIMNGGIILHGTNAETFSVELTPEDGIYYSIHT